MKNIRTLPVGSDVSGYPLAVLNEDIERCHKGYKQAGTSEARKPYFKGLVWLEKQRQELHGVTAKRRRF